ncbi:MAG: hypothetical protein N2039_10300 [Gemmataceae bacterium]|nr:hypothetical protein [Gemmataceae bacterium]
MRWLVLGLLSVPLTVGCLTIPPKATTDPVERDRAEATIAEKLPITTPVPVTAQNCESQVQALQREMDLHLKKLASTRSTGGDTP